MYLTTCVPSVCHESYKHPPDISITYPPLTQWANLTSYHQNTAQAGQAFFLTSEQQATTTFTCLGTFKRKACDEEGNSGCYVVYAVVCIQSTWRNNDVVSETTILTLLKTPVHLHVHAIIPSVNHVRLAQCKISCRCRSRALGDAYIKHPKHEIKVREIKLF